PGPAPARRSGARQPLRLRLRGRVRAARRRRALRGAADCLAGALAHHLQPARPRRRFRARYFPAGRPPPPAGGGARRMIAVVGQPGAWSTERLAHALRAAGAEVLVVDLASCALRLPEPGVWYRGTRLDVEAAVVKKIGDTAGGWSVRERLQILRHW